MSKSIKKIKKPKNISTHLLRFTILSLALVVVTLSLKAQNHRFIQFTTDDGLPTDYVYGVTEDHEGNIWAYTEAGLSRYDGYEWHTLTSQDGLPSNDVVHARISNDGVIYGEAYANKCFALSKDSVYACAQVSSLRYYKNDVAIAQKGSIYKFDTKQSSFKYLFERSNKYSDRFGAHVLSFDSYDIFTKNEIGIYIFKEDQILDSIIFSIGSTFNYYDYGKSNGKERLFIGGDKDFSIYNLQEKQLLTKSYKELGIFDSRFYQLNVFSNFIEIYSDFGFIRIDYDGHIIDRFDTSSLRDEYELNRVQRDSKGNIWIGTRSNGLLMIPSAHQKCKILEAKGNKLAFEGITSAWGRIFTAADNGRLYEIKDNSLMLISKTQNDLHYHNLFYDDVNDLLFFSLNVNPSLQNLKNDFPILNNKLAPQSMKSLPFYDLVLDEVNKSYYAHRLNFITKNKFSLYNLSSSSIIMGRTYVFQYDRATKIKKLLPFNPRLSKIFDGHSNNHVFVSTEKSILRINDDFVIDTLFTDLEEEIGHLYEYDREKFLIGGESKDLFLMDASSSKFNKIHNIGRVKVIKEHDGLFYIGTYTGIYIYDDQFQLLNQYTIYDGLPSNEVHDLEIVDNEIICATSRGIAKVDLAPKIEFKKDTSLVYVTGVNVNGDERNITTLGDLATNENNIGFHFKLLHLPSNGSVEYQYRLLPSSEQWTSTYDRKANFFNLKPGTYKFELKAKDVYEDIHHANRTYSFTIPIPFWKNLIVLFLAFLSILGILIQLMRRRERAKSNQLKEELGLKKRMAELELNAIRSQMNPHFVFNSLGAIQYYIQTHKVDEADSYLTQFALLMRKYLDSSKEKFISVKEEKNLISLYAELEKMRFEDLFNFEVIVEDNSSLQEFLIPTMLVQPFVENAILHGLPKRNDGKGMLTINFTSKKENTCQIEIIDNGVGVKKGKENRSKVYKSRGLNIIEEKIKTLKTLGFTDISIQTENAFNHKEYPGTKVTITIVNE